MAVATEVEAEEDGIEVEDMAQVEVDRLLGMLVTEVSNNNTSGITPQQLEQLMKLLPPPSKSGSTEEYDDDMDLSYANIACCFQAEMIEDAWIID